MAKNFIKTAIKHPGALHKTLKVPAGKTIPLGKIEKASHSKDATTRKRANLALTLRNLPRHHGSRSK